jgi:hypothetical protein
VGLQDFASVFSRSFVVGFFVPAFVAVFALDQIGTDSMMPASFRDASTGTQTLVLGGLGVVVGILLSGLRFPILRAFGTNVTELRAVDSATTRTQRGPDVAS